MNPAERVLQLVEHFKSWPQDKSVMDGWMNFLGVEVGEDGEHAVHTAVLAFQQEIRAIRQALVGEMQAPDQLFRACSETLRNGFSPQTLHHQWQGLSQSILAPQVELSLRWASWTFRARQEAPLDEAILESLRTQLSEIEELLSKAGASAQMTLTLSQIAVALRDALALYKVKGVAPLQEAVQQAVGAINSSPTELRKEAQAGSEEARTVIAKVFKVIGTAAKVTDDVSKIKKFGEGVYGWSLVKLDTLSDWWSNVPALPSPTLDT
jgi:hypothetical protein